MTPPANDNKLPLNVQPVTYLPRPPVTRPSLRLVMAYCETVSQPRT